LLLSGLGLLQSGQQAKAQQDGLSSGVKASKAEALYRGSALERIFGAAEKYDPAASNDLAIQDAERTSGAVLDRGLRSLETRYSGANPGGDTQFAIDARGVADRVIDPFRSFVAQLRAEQPLQKIRAYQGVLSIPPGQVSDQYFKAASMMPAGDITGSVGLLTPLLQRLFQSKGAGGSGDRVNNDLSFDPLHQQSTSLGGYTY